MKRIIFIIRFLLIGWWFIPSIWLLLYPVAFLLSNGDLVETKKLLININKSVLYGENQNEKEFDNK